MTFRRRSWIVIPLVCVICIVGGYVGYIGLQFGAYWLIDWNFERARTVSNRVQVNSVMRGISEKPVAVEDIQNWHGALAETTSPWTLLSYRTFRDDMFVVQYDTATSQVLSVIPVYE